MPPCLRGTLRLFLSGNERKATAQCGRLHLRVECVIFAFSSVAGLSLLASFPFSAGPADEGKRMKFIRKLLRDRRARRKSQKNIVIKPIENRDYISAAYYQNLHDKNKAYRKHNWLVDQKKLFAYAKEKTVLEFGCGNGKFTRKVAKVADRVIALDWARGSAFDSMPGNVTFVQDSVLTAKLPSADIVCSGDVLEHFDKSDLADLLPKIHAAGQINYHVIACYDDNHSHLTIEPKEWWLAQFQAIDATYKLLNDGTEDRDIAIVSNGS